MDLLDARYVPHQQIVQFVHYSEILLQTKFALLVKRVLCLLSQQLPLPPSVTQELVCLLYRCIDEYSIDPVINISNLYPGCSRRYLWRPASEIDDSGDLCEILKFSDEPRSWFVDNSIQTGMHAYT